MKLLKGISAASGVTMGVTCLYTNEVESTLPHYAIEDAGIPLEIERLKAAIAHAKQEMLSMIQVANVQFDKKAAGIFDTHLLIIGDESLLKKIVTCIESKRVNAEHAVSDAFEEYIARYRAEEGHFRELTHDFVDARNRILAGFNVQTGKFKCEIGEQRAVVVAAKRLTPSMVLNIHKEHVLAFITEEGGFTSHATILARSYGVPIIFGIDVEKELDCGLEIVADGSRGEIIISPDEKTRSYYAQKIENLQKKKNVCAINQDVQARTKTGQRIMLKVNISTPDELELLRDVPHDGIGLLRTEFLFMQRDMPPTEEEQYLMYRRIFKDAAGWPVTVRLLDIGADKLPQFMRLPDDVNADLELRGALAVETFPAIYRTQVRALLRAAVDSELRLLYPMVSDSSDLATFRSVVHGARQSLETDKLPFNSGFKEGIMIETPAAVMMADELMEQVDFINIGSNDLLQYTLAASRGNMLAEKRYHILHPALVKMLAMVARTSRQAKKEVCLCGEAASFEEFYPLLLQAGLASFSVTVSKFNDIKCELMHLQKKKGKDLLEEFYKTASKEEADRYFQKLLS
jgi:phosphotransferase system enzyme I (PtsI)